MDISKKPKGGPFVSAEGRFPEGRGRPTTPPPSIRLKVSAGRMCTTLRAESLRVGFCLRPIIYTLVELELIHIAQKRAKTITTL